MLTKGETNSLSTFYFEFVVCVVEAQNDLKITNIISREPKKRCMWLRIWMTHLEREEEENPWALAFDETEELQLEK